jgi:hypothetical protein
MTVIAKVGFSRHPDAQQAGSDAAAQALVELGGPANLIIAFITERYEPGAALQAIRSETNTAPLFGCATGGVITPQGLATDGVAVMALRSEDLSIAMAAEAAHPTPGRTGEAIAKTLARQVAMSGAEDDYGVALTLINPFNCHPTQVVGNIMDGLGPQCPLAGAVSAGVNVALDAGQETQPMEIGPSLQVNTVSTALLRSPVPIGIGVGHGFKPAGRPLVVTRSASNLVYELNGQPAFEVYWKMWGDELPQADSPELSATLKRHPLGLPQIGGEYLVRDPAGIKPNGAIEFAATVPENAVVHVMTGDQEDIIAAARAAAQQAMDGLAGRSAAAAIIFDCVSRLDLLGDAAGVEIDHIRNVIGDQTPCIGFFSWGEIAAPPGLALAALHNKAVVVCALAQR